MTPERLAEIGANVERFDAALAKSNEADRQLAALMDADPRTPRKPTPEECAADDVAQAAERELSVCWGAVEMSAACRELLAELARATAERDEAARLSAEFREWQQGTPDMAHRCVQHISADAAAFLARLKGEGQS
jgi:hypothetical protein